MKKNITSQTIGRGNGVRIPSVWGFATAVKNRVWALCLALTVLVSPVFAQETKPITLEVKDAPIVSVIKQIEQQSGYTFFYNTKDIETVRNVSLNLHDSDLKSALNHLFRGTGITWSIDEKHVILKGGADARPQPAQADRLSGKIVDKNGMPIIGATIIVAGSTTQGTTTDIDGMFYFPWSSQIASATLNISFIGYVSQSVPVGGRTMLDITLLEDNQQLEAVVVTALGIKRAERAVSYNVQNVITDEVFKAKDISLANNLSGRIAGVQINSSAAGIGGETKIVMRGTKSINNDNNALYVLDGIPLPSLSTASPSASYTIMRTSNPSGDGISMFNSDDIGNMSVLTGPSSAALYGSKAANGVVMLSTRTGEEGLSVSYSNNTTFMSPFMMPDFQRSYGALEGSFGSWSTTRMSKASTWSPEDFFQTGYNTTNSVSLSFGKGKSSTYLSAGVVKAEGIIPNNEFNRYNFTASHTNSFLKDRMHLSVLGMYINLNEQNMLASGQYYNPLVPIYLLSPSEDLNKYAVYERYDASRNFKTQYWDWGDMGMSMQNPYWIINRNMFNTAKNRFLMGASLSYDITDWLDVTARARIDYTDMLAEQKNYASTNKLFAGDYGRYYYNEYRTMQRYGDVMANINKTFFDQQLSLTATIGASIEDLKYRATLLGGDLTSVANLFTLSNMTANKASSKTTYNDQTQSVFATVQLGFRNMVFLDLTGRNDWSTALVNTKSLSMFYPSVGLSAVVTDIFGIQSKVLSYAKIRASYAEVGNAPMRYITVPTYPVSSSGPQTTTFLTAENYEPERTKSWEVGADVRLWGNKIIVGATYYNSRTLNQIFQPSISSTSTKTSMYVNGGRVDNKGVELSLEVNQKLGPVDWQSNVIYSRNRNKIVRMLHDYEINGERITQDSMVMGGTTGVKMVVREGGRMGDLYVNTLKTDDHGYIWVSPAGDIATDPNNFIYAGNTNPSYTLSWRNSFNWKGFSLGFMFNARVGGVGVSLTQAAMDYYGVSAVTAEARDNGGVLINGQRVGKIQSYYEKTANLGEGAIGSCYVYSMTNVRLGELTFGYDFPVQKWCKWIKGLNVSFIGRNLLMLYCKAPFDPELVSGSGTYSSGIDYFQQPSLRNLGFSVKVTF